MRRRFDEIVDFAEVERFLDLPVKKYSSGMYVRLAFAIAAHLEPEILIVDEVLAVGDTKFQEKCLGKMGEVSRREGRTVLFVSHNLAAVGELTRRGIVLDAGSIVANAPISEAISTYLAQGENQQKYVSPLQKQSDKPHVSHVEVVTSDGNGIHQFGRPLEIRFRIRHQQPVSDCTFSFRIINQFQQPIIHAFAYPPQFIFGTKAGDSFLVCHLPAPKLNVGRFHIRTSLGQTPGGEHYETVDGICPFSIVRTDYNVLWGWQPDFCAYHEEWAWTVV